MTYIFAVLCTILMVSCLFLLLLGLPGVWCILGLVGLWSFFTGTPALGWHFFLFWGGIAAAGEAIEFFAGFYGAKYFGGSSKGSVAGVIGALIGAILCAPFFLGIGALLGGLAGGFLACFAVELAHGKTALEARLSAYGVTLGRFGGFVVKLAIAVALLWNSIPIILQSAY